MKKMLATILGVSFLCTPAQALSIPMDKANNSMVIANEQVKEQDKITMVSGTVKQIGNDKIICNIFFSNGYKTLKISDDTLFLDSGNAVKGDIKDIKTGDFVYIFPDSSQENAYAIVYNVPQDARSAMLHKIEQVVQSKDGITQILTDNGGLYIDVNSDAVITKYSDGSKLSLSDLKEGQMVFAWYDAVKESYPAKTGTSRIVVVDGNSTNTVNTADIIVNGNTLSTKAVLKDGVWAVPMRETAEALGLEVSWDSSNRVATMQSDSRIMNIKIGEDLYVSAATQESGLIGMTSPQNLGCKAYIENDLTWIPAKAFEVLVGFNVNVDNNKVTITAQ